VTSATAQLHQPRAHLLAKRIYAFGDIHGCTRLLEEAWQKVEDDLRQRALPLEHVLEVYLGDYLDRGPDSKGVVERLIQRRAARRALCLAGNHEDIALKALDDLKTFSRWLLLGAPETLISYGITPPLRQAHDVARAHREYRAGFPESHRRFLRSLPLFHVNGSCLFVHAGLRPGVLLEHQSAADLTMIRQPFLGFRGDHGYLVVHGHTPVREPEIMRNRVNIDTGAFATGRLTCLAIEGCELRVL